MQLGGLHHVQGLLDPLDHVPPELQGQLLQPARGLRGSSVRGTCKPLRASFDAGRTALKLRWPTATPNTQAWRKLRTLLARLPHLQLLRAGASSRLSSGYSCHPRRLASLALPSVTTLDLRGSVRLTSVQPLAACRSLTSLDLARCRGLYDISGLAGCPALVKLSLSKCHRVDLSHLLLTALTDLDLSQCRLFDYSPLAALTSLVRLRLFSSDITLVPLSSCTALADLGLGRCSIFDLQPLAACTSLITLSLRGCRQVTTVGALAALPRLERLQATRVFDLRPLAACTALRRLGMSHCPAVEIGSVPALLSSLGLRV